MDRLRVPKELLEMLDLLAVMSFPVRGERQAAQAGHGVGDLLR
jgi:hypothetical protein